MKTPCILILNAGSSSLKFKVFGLESDLPVLTEGRITGLGVKPVFNTVDKSVVLDLDTSQAQGLAFILGWLQDQLTDFELECVGHRIVHGGRAFSEPVALNPVIVEQLQALVSLAPLHQPHNLHAIKLLADNYPQLLQIGCFDTAFHSRQASMFKRYALPHWLYERGVQRYGFHGLSYEWIAQTILQDPQLAKARIVAAHLGNGSSLCAIKAGKSIDTTMGMTALDGLPMGTRCGNLDPGVVLHMQRELGMTAIEIENILSLQSGLKGLSGISSDVRELLASQDPAAQWALDFYSLMTAQQIARMGVALGGIDAIVFTGGIGENAQPVKDRILSHLAWLPPFQVLTIAANEERMIAQHGAKLWNESKG
jgi:acetate kinase